VRALLFRLAAEVQPLSRSSLCYLFWADCPDAEARQNLSRLLVYLGRALPRPDLLLADDAYIQLHHPDFEIDAAGFERHWEAWKSTHACQALKSAVDLLRGPFLQGFYLPRSPEFNLWVQTMERFWEQRVLKVLALLVESASASGDLELAIESANRYLASDNLAEDIHRRLIELYALRGERSAALRQYERCSATLEKELGVLPAPETTAAYRAVLDRKPAPRLLPAAVPAWNILPSLNAPLVGRQDALAELESALTQARQGHGVTILVSGEPGIGKSRLVQEFILRSRPRTRLLTGSALRECGAIPYQPLVEAFQPMLGSPSILDAVSAVWIAEAGALFPELAPPRQPHRSSGSLSAEAARQRLFQALFYLLIGCTDGGSTAILCLDDLHWADPTTLEWLAYAASRIANQRILIVATCRQGESQALSALIASLQRLSNYRQISLPGLTQADIDYLCEIAGISARMDAPHSDRLRRVTGGNPFFILEILRQLQESASVDELPLPPTVQAAVRARLERLHPQVRQVLEAAAVLGLTFSFNTVHQTSGRQEMEILDGLDELVARQFLVESPSGYHFYHGIIREAVYTSLSYWRKRRLHARAALALEKTASQDWTAIAWHMEQSAQFGKAARYALRAAQAARSVFAHVEGRANCDHALELLEKQALDLTDRAAIEANQRLMIEALNERGWTLRLLGDMDTYARDLTTIASLAQALGDAHTLAQLRRSEAYNHRWFCRYSAAIAAAEEGLRLSRECGDRHLEALCQRELGMAWRETGDYVPAQAALLQALDLFQGQAEDMVYTVHTLGNLSTLHCRRENYTQALELARQALHLCERDNLPFERRLPLGDMGAASLHAGDYTASRAALSESLQIARETADRSQEIFCLGHLGWLSLKQRDFLSGVGILQQALDLAVQLGSRTEQSWLHAGLAEGFFASGETRLAIQHASLAASLAGELGRLPDLRRAEQIIIQLNDITAEPHSTQS
jgi:DNA-binding SARP family transcriptional activator